MQAQTSALKLDDTASPNQHGTQDGSTPQPAGAAAPETAAKASPPDSMDAIVEGLLIAGLHNVDDDELPVQTNEFYSKTVLGCKPPGKHCQFQGPHLSQQCQLHLLIWLLPFDMTSWPTLC